MSRAWDVVVIGAGVAGLTAARAVAGAGRSCVVIDRMGPGGVLINLTAIHDYAEVAPETNGADFAAGLLDVAMAAGVELAIELAQEAGITLLGFVREESLNIYTHGSRIGGV